jgi:hypothetical protein
MRGAEPGQRVMFSSVDLEQRIPDDHPLWAIQALVEPVLRELSPRFAPLYADSGRGSVAQGWTGASRSSMPRRSMPLRFPAATSTAREADRARRSLRRARRRHGPRDRPRRVAVACGTPLLSGWLVLGLLVLSVGMFMALIERISLVPIHRMLGFTAHYGRRVIEQTYPGLGAAASTPDPAEVRGPPGEVTLRHTGRPRTIQALDLPAVLALSSASGAVVDVDSAVGDTLVEGTVMARVFGGHRGPRPADNLGESWSPSLDSVLGRAELSPARKGCEPGPSAATCCSTLHSTTSAPCRTWLRCRHVPDRPASRYRLPVS